MKKILLLIAFLSKIYLGLAQSPLTGYEGIVLEKATWPYIIYSENGTPGARTQAAGGKFVVTSTNGETNHLSVNSTSGKVGIGTDSPSGQLEIVTGNRKVGLNTDISGVSSGGILSLSRPDDGAKIMYLGGAAAPNNDAVVFGSGGGSEMRIVSSGGSSAGFGFYTNISLASAFGTSRPTPVLKIDGSGNVGIGTASPNQKLTVNGTIYGKEVKVDLSVPGPDYVFENNYRLRSLEETKTYIEQNKHLPEVPSAKEMGANGINLSEMNMLLLRKIEEITLYLLEQDKTIAELKARPDLSGKKVEELTLYVIQLRKKDKETELLLEEMTKKINDLKK